MNYFFIFFLIFSIFEIFYSDNNFSCFEYACENCTSEKYGDCIKCRNSFKLIDGTCPCADPSCAICTSGYAGLHICKLCRNGFYRKENDCQCEIPDCEICEENNCKLCRAGYFFNATSKACEEQKDVDKIPCHDPNCDGCYNTNANSCIRCKDGYSERKGICIKMPDKESSDKCPSGYYLDDKTCEKNCAGVNCDKREFNYFTCESNKCLVCTENVLEIFSECNNSQVCTKDGCLNCITDAECVICTPGYYLLGGECKRCINGCAYCTNPTTCEYCLFGYNLNSAGECVLDYNYDFNPTLYKKIRNDLIKSKFPKEKVDELSDTSELPKCDINCDKCYDSTGKCVECKPLHNLENNVCVKYCTDKNCLTCSLFYGNEQCTSCKEGYEVKSGKCAYICSDSNCLSCNYENDTETCTKCMNDYEVNDKNPSQCKAKINYLTIIFIVVGSLIIIASIVAFCFYQKKKREFRIEIERIRNLNNPRMDGMVVYNRHGLEDSARSEINQEQILDEYEIQKGKMEKGNQLCQYCQKKPGKFKSDCGCIVCKEHAALKEMEGDGEKYKVCFACGIVVKKITPIKFNCHICMQSKSSVAHFKCGCALQVCKECYLKCKINSNKCPGCRAII